MKTGTRKTEYVVQEKPEESKDGWEDVGIVKSKDIGITDVKHYTKSQKSEFRLLYFEYRLIRRETIEFVEDV